jgi:hypothetical protein
MKLAVVPSPDAVKSEFQESNLSPSFSPPWMDGI